MLSKTKQPCSILQCSLWALLLLGIHSPGHNSWVVSAECWWTNQMLSRNLACELRVNHITAYKSYWVWTLYQFFFILFLGMSCPAIKVVDIDRNPLLNNNSKGESAQGTASSYVGQLVHIFFLTHTKLLTHHLDGIEYWYQIRKMVDLLFPKWAVFLDCLVKNGIPRAWIVIIPQYIG